MHTELYWPIISNGHIRVVSQAFKKEAQMANDTKISWTNKTLNPAVGCDKVSEECRNCYASLDACRRADNPTFPLYEGVVSRKQPNSWGKNHDWSGRVNYSMKKLDEIRKLPPGSMCFINSMSDSFHTGLPEEFIQKMFQAMNARPDVTFQVLTKRAQRLAEMANTLNWTDNIWMGVTVGVDKSRWRLDCLRQVPAKIRWVSAEPLLEEVDYSPWLADGTLNWVVVGGESKSGWRPLKAEWVRAARDACISHNVPFFFKQWAGFAPIKHPQIDGRHWEQWPMNLEELPGNLKIPA